MTPSSPSHTPQPLAQPTQQRDNAVSGVDSGTFGEGVRLLPRAVQADIRQLYHVLRTIDDLVDDGDPRASQRVEALERWAHGEQLDPPETRILTTLARAYPLRPQAVIEF